MATTPYQNKAKRQQDKIVGSNEQQTYYPTGSNWSSRLLLVDDIMPESNLMESGILYLFNSSSVSSDSSMCLYEILSCLAIADIDTTLIS